MGLQLTYDTDETSVTLQFSHADWETIEAVRAHLTTDVDLCFNVPDFGEPVRVNAAALKASAAAIDQFLKSNRHLLPATYQFKFERVNAPNGPPDEFDTGGVSGIRLPGDPNHWYGIRAGLNKCFLQKWAADPQGGINVRVDTIDLRGKTEILTENWGILRIRRRAAKTSLRRRLGEIAEFINHVTAAEVTKTLG